MSTIAAIIQREYVVLAVDSRSLAFDGSGSLVQAQDGSQKVYPGPFGFMVGAGDQYLCEAVGNALEKAEITGIPKLNRLIGRAYAAESWRRGRRPHFKKDLKSTTMVFTGIMDGEVRFLCYSGAKKKEELCGLIPSGDAFAIAPYGSPDGTDIAIQALLRRYIRPLSEFASVAESAVYHGGLVRQAILEISKHSEVVSPNGLGVLHAATGERAVVPFSAEPAHGVVTSVAPAPAQLVDEIAAVLVA